MYLAQQSQCVTISCQAGLHSGMATSHLHSWGDSQHFQNSCSCHRLFINCWSSWINTAAKFQSMLQMVSLDKEQLQQPPGPWLSEAPLLLLAQLSPVGPLRGFSWPSVISANLHWCCSKEDLSLPYSVSELHQVFSIIHLLPSNPGHISSKFCSEDSSPNFEYFIISTKNSGKWTTL